MKPPDDGLGAGWLDAWPGALEAWSRATALREPALFESDAEAAERGMEGEIAAIRLTDHTVAVNLATVRARHLEGHALAILAHEVGHHVYVPASLTDNARLLAVVGRMLEGTPKSKAGLVANLYADLLVNDRLQRRAGIDVAAVFRVLRVEEGSAVWKLYTRTYEHLWRLPPASIAPGGVTDELDADALLVARIVRSFAGEWLAGARRFAAIVYRYLAEDLLAERGQPFERLGLDDTKGAGRPAPGEDPVSALPDGLAALDAAEGELSLIHI